MQIVEKSVNEVGDAYFKIIFENRSDTLKIMLASDIHLDSIYSDTKLFQEHLKRAVEENVYILLIGDILDIMQLRLDKRAHKSELANDLVGGRGDYLNQIIEKTVNFFLPYKNNILLMTYGNHELSILKKYEIDMLKLITQQLGCLLGGYDGYITFNWHLYNEAGTNFTRRIYYHHGIGGNAPMTMGILNHKRADIWIRGADIVLSGHRHKTFYYEEVVMDINHRNQRTYRNVLHLQLPTYQKKDGAVSFSTVRGYSPSAMGAYVIEFKLRPVYDNGRVRTHDVAIDLSRWT